MKFDEAIAAALHQQPPLKRRKKKAGGQAGQKAKPQMPTVSPWHSTRPGEQVYHNNTACTEGNNIEDRYRKPGTGGLRLCDRCAKLNAERK